MDTDLKAGGDEAQEGGKSRAVAKLKTAFKTCWIKIKSMGWMLIVSITITALGLSISHEVQIKTIEAKTSGLEAKNSALEAKNSALEAKYRALEQKLETKAPTGDVVSESELRQLLQFFNSGHTNLSQILEKQSIFDTKLDQLLNSLILLNSSLFMIQKE